MWKNKTKENLMQGIRLFFGGIEGYSGEGGKILGKLEGFQRIYFLFQRLIEVYESFSSI
jgi:hypothetical protein